MKILPNGMLRTYSSVVVPETFRRVHWFVDLSISPDKLEKTKEKIREQMHQNRG